MKFLEIPENTNELRDYNHFLKIISEVQEFNSNIETFLEKVLFDEFYKTVGEWKKIIKPEDNKKIGILFTDETKTTKFNISQLRSEIRELKRNIKDRQNAIKEYSKRWGEKDTKSEQKLLDKDKKRLDELEDELYGEQDTSKYDDFYIFYCYETNKFIRPEHYKSKGYWRHIGKKCITKIKPSKDGMKINLLFQHTYKEYPTPGWLPTFHATIEYQIDLIKKSVEEIDQNLRETSNKNYR